MLQNEIYKRPIILSVVWRFATAVRGQLDDRLLEGSVIVHLQQQTLREFLWQQHKRNDFADDLLPEANNYRQFMHAVLAVLDDGAANGQRCSRLLLDALEDAHLCCGSLNSKSAPSFMCRIHESAANDQRGCLHRIC